MSGLEELKDNYLVICLSAICLLLFVVVMIDQLDIKKGMAKEIKELKVKIQELEQQLAIKSHSYDEHKNNGYSRTAMQQQSDKALSNQAPNSCMQTLSSRSFIAGSTSALHNDNDAKTSHLEGQTIHEQQEITYNYLLEANNGKFLKLMQTPDKCFFRTWVDGKVRKFEFFGNIAKALANINAIFDDTCDIEGRRSGATDIENISAGTLDSELRIISKAKIKLK